MLDDKRTEPKAKNFGQNTYITEYFQATNFQFNNNVFSYDVIRSGKRKQNGYFLGYLEKAIIYRNAYNFSDIDKNNFAQNILPLEPYIRCDDYPKICRLIGVQFPKWLQILQNYNYDCQILHQEFKIVEQSNANRLKKWERERKHFKLKKVTYHEKQNFWPMLLLAPFTFGISLFFLTTPKRAQKNITLNQKNTVWNNNFLRDKYQKFSEKMTRQQKQILTKWNGELKTFTEKYRGFSFHRLFMADYNLKFHDAKILVDDKNNPDLVKALSKRSGIYIIWNFTKQNKYYVGQTNDLYRRLVNEHFSLKSNLSTDEKSDFPSDMKNNCVFYFTFIYCENKPEVKDKLEREVISKLKSVVFGYNKSGGNS